MSKYNKTTWNSGDTITDTKMNNLEVGVENAHKELETKINVPSGGNGSSGQILSTNGDGTTTWINKPADGANGLPRLKAKKAILVQLVQLVLREILANVVLFGQ